MVADYTIENHGSVWLCRPNNSSALSHLEDHTSDESIWFAGALAVEPRYVDDLIDTTILDSTSIRSSVHVA